MKYYVSYSEDIEFGKGVSYQEIDEECDLVVRQVDVYGNVYRWGEWTGTSLVGWICDRRPSTLGFMPEEEITAEEFEAVWKRARR